ncbi:MAG: DUF4843 domain-containing protein [Prevotella sp.]
MNKKSQYRLSALQSLVILCGSLAMGLLSACSTDEIDGWQSKGFVWFTDTLQDFTNKQQPDVAEGETLRIAVPLTIAGEIKDYDRTVNVEVTKQPSDSRTVFSIEQPVTIHAGKTTDSMYVDLVNSSHLDTVYDSIQFHITASDDFDPGLQSQLYTTVALHNGYQRPSWWDDDCERVFGYFTQLKMEVFIICTGSTEDIRTNKEYWSSNDIAVQYWIYVFNDYIEQNDIRYPDDDPYAPGERPSFSFWSY